MVKTNSLRAWWLAARPKTLTGAAAPVILAVSAAYGIYGQIEWSPQFTIYIDNRKNGNFFTVKNIQCC